jgi:hypothetical protein
MESVERLKCSDFSGETANDAYRHRRRWIHGHDTVVGILHKRRPDLGASCVGPVRIARECPTARSRAKEERSTTPSGRPPQKGANWGQHCPCDCNMRTMRLKRGFLLTLGASMACDVNAMRVECQRNTNVLGSNPRSPALFFSTSSGFSLYRPAICDAPLDGHPAL